jgi:glutamyl/glutaminyl-tRNA synthetase
VLEAPGGREALAGARAALEDLPEPWTEDSVQAALDGAAERLGVKRKQVFQPLRVAVAGTTVSPGIFETIALLGRGETLARVDHALNGRRAS